MGYVQQIVAASRDYKEKIRKWKGNLMESNTGKSQQSTTGKWNEKLSGMDIMSGYFGNTKPLNRKFQCNIYNSGKRDMESFQNLWQLRAL